MNEFSIKDPASIFPDPPDMQKLGQVVLRDDAQTLVAALRANPASADQKGVHGVGLLMMAVVLNKPAAVRILMRAGADPHAVTSDVANLGRPAAMALRMQSNPDLLAIMIEEGLDINGGREGDGESLLALAVMEKGDARLRQLLSTRKANVNLADSVQATPLIRAIRSHQYDKALLLLDAGASPSLGRSNPLQVLSRRRWEPGSPNDVLSRQLADRMRAQGLSESTPMKPAPARG